MSPVAPASILIVHPDPAVREHLARTLEREEWQVDGVPDAGAALERVRRAPPDLVLTARRLPDLDGLELVEALRRADRDVDALALAPVVDIDVLTTAQELGVLDVLPEAPEAGELQRSVADALERRRIRRARFGDGPSPPADDEGVRLVGRSEAMQEVYRGIARYARIDATVLIVGETGTGKGLVAEEIHRCSERANEPFVPVPLGSVAEHLAESELFGHRKGAFTGAERDHRGWFERAGRGTIFLDEIGDLPLEVQPKLLDILETRRFTRVGGETTHATGARVLAATHRDLGRDVRKGRFREDLYHRLHVAVIEVPPLRERMEDLEDLVPHLLARAAAQHRSAPPPILAPGVLDRLRTHRWPGNVRQLENCLARAVAAVRAGVILPGDLEIERMAPMWSGEPDAKESAAGPASVGSAVAPGDGKVSPVPGTPSRWLAPDGTFLTLEEANRLHIQAALDRRDDNVTHAARLLGMPRSTLQSRMKALGIERDRP